MDQQTIEAVDRFVTETVAPQDEALREALAAAEAAGLPSIQVSAPQGRLLQILVRLLGAERILEFGTLGAYSTILMARELAPGGRLISLEAKADYAEVARATSSGPASPIASRCGSARPWRRCRSSRKRASAPSTWSSSTPTRRTRPTTSPGPWSGPAPAA